jgi:hypothetical protein
MATKLDTSPVSLQYPAGTNFDLVSARRLIVLVPREGDYTALARRIWELADAVGSQVVLLGLCAEEAQESSLRRQLVTMSAMIQHGKVYAEVQIEMGSNWVNAVRCHLQQGDMIVCFAEQRAGLLHRTLSQILETNLGAPVYILSDLSSQTRAGANLLSGMTAWVGFLGIIAGAFLLQIRIVSTSAGWAQASLLIASIFAEFGLILVWNRQFG